MKKILIQKPPQIIKRESLSELALLLGIDCVEFLRVTQYAETMYQPIQLLKKSGTEFRTIHAPNPTLKKIQRSILDKVLVASPLPPYVYGFGQNKTIVDNAKRHRSNPYLLNIDIKNFFPSVHYKKIYRIFTEYGCTDDQALALTKVTTLSNGLPQGAPTSPYLASLALNNLDYRLMTLCKKNRLIYTRYFDDISISGGERAHSILETVKDKVENEGYKIHTSGVKIQMYGPKDNKIVTGIYIDTNGELSAPDSVLIENYLLDIKRNGLSSLHSENIEKEKESVRGKIAFISQINPNFGRRLMELFMSLTW